LAVQKYDRLKHTLTDFVPARFAAATDAAHTPQQAAAIVEQSAAEDVPKERTTHVISKRGIIPPPPSAKPKREAAGHPAAVIRPEVVEETAPAAAIAPEVVEESAAPPAAAIRPEVVEETAPVAAITPELADDAAPEWNSPAPIAIEETAAASPARTEAAAALHVRAAQRRPKKAVDPNDMVLVNFRIPKYQRDAFFKTCRDNDRTPSLAIRNLIKSYCGL
jgi:hypothetical protein